jgi:ribose transport system substrate-binding protein
MWTNISVIDFSVRWHQRFIQQRSWRFMKITKQPVGRTRLLTIRKVASVATATVLSLAALAACSSTSATGTTSGSGTKLAAGQSFKLGVSLTLNNTDFWTSYIKYEGQFAKKYKADLLGPIVANGDAGKQITDIHTLISEGAQALIVNPVDSAAIKPALDFAASKGIPVVSVDVAPTAGKVAMIVRANNKLYGTEACDYIGSQVKSGSVAQLQGDLASLNGRDRSDAFISCMKTKYPALTVVNYPTKWNSTTATNDAATALGSVKDLAAIYTQWSGPVPGILQALKAANRLSPAGSPNHVVVVSNDGVPFELADIRSGVLDATIDQPADQYAQYSVLYARDILEGKTFKKDGMSLSNSGPFVTLYGNLEDPIKAPLATKSNVDDKSLWGNNTGQ